MICKYVKRPHRFSKKGGKSSYLIDSYLQSLYKVSRSFQRIHDCDVNDNASSRYKLQLDVCLNGNISFDLCAFLCLKYTFFLSYYVCLAYFSLILLSPVIFYHFFDQLVLAFDMNRPSCFAPLFGKNPFDPIKHFLLCTFSFSAIVNGSVAFLPWILHIFAYVSFHRAPFRIGLELIFYTYTFLEIVCCLQHFSSSMVYGANSMAL